MTEEDARAAIMERFGAERTERLAAFLALVIAENEIQNLIAPSTIGLIWDRHVLDSAQLVPLAAAGLWIDIGTGGGFPGMVAALLRDNPIILVEPRRRRADFLLTCLRTLDILNAEVVSARIETISNVAATISARAVSSVENILHMAAGCANEETRWLLPRGRSGEADLVALQRDWQGRFHVEQSLTDPEASILVLERVSRR